MTFYNDKKHEISLIESEIHNYAIGEANGMLVEMLNDFFGDYEFGGYGDIEVYLLEVE